MSEFHVTCFKIENIQQHPNADRLEITNVFGGYPCCVQKGQFKLGDLAVYIPVDVVLPNRQEFAFLSDSDRKHLKAKRFRGTFSMGLVIPAPENAKEDDELADYFGITRFEAVDNEDTQEKYISGENEKDPAGWHFIKYTDIESFRKQKHRNCFNVNEEVVLAEKVHGQNYRIVYKDNKLWVGSRSCNKRLDVDNPSSWWKLAIKYDLENKLKNFPDLVIFGEEYGQVQDLKYGLNERKLILFDIFDLKKQTYIDYDNARQIATELKLEWVPEIYRGKLPNILDESILGQFNQYAEGKSLLADNVREGFVIRPVHERYDHRVGRVILKLHGQGYLTRKEK